MIKCIFNKWLSVFSMNDWTKIWYGIYSENSTLVSHPSQWLKFKEFWVFCFLLVNNSNIFLYIYIFFFLLLNQCIPNVNNLILFAVQGNLLSCSFVKSNKDWNTD